QPPSRLVKAAWVDEVQSQRRMQVWNSSTEPHCKPDELAVKQPIEPLPHIGSRERALFQIRRGGGPLNPEHQVKWAWFGEHAAKIDTVDDICSVAGGNLDSTASQLHRAASPEWHQLLALQNRSRLVQ